MNPSRATRGTGFPFLRDAYSRCDFYPVGYDISGKSWLSTIAHRALVDYYRRQLPNTKSMDGLNDTLLDPAMGPEDGAVVSEQVHQVLRIIAGLNQEQQEVIGLRFLAELRYDEISHITGKGESAVKMIATVLWKRSEGDISMSNHSSRPDMTQSNLVAAFLAPIKAQWDVDVAAGKITAAQETEDLTNFQKKLSIWVTMPLGK